MCLFLVRLNEIVCRGLLPTVVLSLIATTQVQGQGAKAATNQSAATQATNQSSNKQKPSTAVGGKSTANSVQPSTPASNQPNAAQSSLAKLASTASTANTESQGDYIPCKFTVPELIGLVAPEVASTLTGADEEILKQRVFGAAISQAGDGTQRSTDFVAFVKKLSEDSLSGLTPSQALNHIIQALAASGSKLVTSADIATFEQSVEAQLPPDTVKVFERFMKSEFDVSKESIPNSQLSSVVPKKFSEWAKEPGETAPSKSQTQQITEALSKVQPMDTSSIVDAARNTIGILERPPDIGCAMSILTYDETKQAYGYMIANNYIAVQVVVRNLNRDLAFVLHDVEFEVNTDATGRLGRFFSGRDKVIVRSLSAAQSSFDPRAIFVHSSHGIGSILSAIVPIFRAETVTDATAVFNGAFVPGLDKYWKDQTADQLNLLNDTGFSSQASSQTAVPESGTLMFVTFIPSQPFEEGWWTQPCVEKLYLGTTDRLGFVRNLATGTYTRKTTKSSGQLGGVAANPRGEQTGVDVARALEVCQLGYDPLPRKKHWKRDYSVATIATEASEDASATSGSAGAPTQNHTTTSEDGPARFTQVSTQSCAGESI